MKLSMSMHSAFRRLTRPQRTPPSLLTNASKIIGTIDVNSLKDANGTQHLQTAFRSCQQAKRRARNHNPPRPLFDLLTNDGRHVTTTACAGPVPNGIIAINSVLSKGHVCRHRFRRLEEITFSYEFCNTPFRRITSRTRSRESSICNEFASYVCSHQIE